eukprot:TRINITY_DN18152_c0_g1_i1.p1 TRINITY_DN18152_c0_g1~~TRINITY_DN18152_c0_g1_i1.p1  ORF type:complete len:208 (+),score=19.31 TRINITY_DN18152_c0_g1_i1:79-702(+)
MSSVGSPQRRAHIDPSLDADPVSIDDAVFDDTLISQEGETATPNYHYYPGLIRRNQHDPLQNMSNEQGIYTFGAWGVRTRKPKTQTTSAKQRALRGSTRVNLPVTAISVDPTTKRPAGPCSLRTEARFSGAWTLTPPYNKRYGYYKKFGSSSHHGFPGGSPPSPEHIYSTGVYSGRPRTPKPDITAKISSSPFVRPATAPPPATVKR